MRLVLLDRDGVLNENRADYVKHPDELVLLPGAGKAIARLNQAGIRVAVVTNQSVVGRGIIAESMLCQIHDHLRHTLKKEGARLDAIFYCTDTPDAAGPRRKPNPGMLTEALERFSASPATTPMIGDALRDLEAGAALGCPRILVRTGNGAVTQAAGLPEGVLPVAVYENLSEAVDSLLKEGK